MTTGTMMTTGTATTTDQVIAAPLPPTAGAFGQRVNGMLRLLRVCVTGLALCLALPALAQGIEEEIVAQLRAQGYEEFEVERTLLGRLRIVAIGQGLRREIVIQPATGAILRDYVTRLSGGGGAATPVLRDRPTDEDDDDRDEDRDDDRDDRDDDRDDRDDDRDDRDDDRDDRDDDRDDDDDGDDRD